MAGSARGELHVLVADDLDALATDLAAHLATRHHAVLRRDVVVVPTPGIGRWLSTRLATSLGAAGRDDGVCANVDFLLWGGLLGRLECRRPRDEDPWSIGAMAFRALGILGAAPDSRRGDGRAASGAVLRYPEARADADLFDQLFRWRPDVADAWLDAASVDPRAPVLRSLADRTTAPPPHRALRSLLANLEAGRDEDVLLPPCVHLFGGDSLAGGPSAVALLEALAVTREVVVHLVAPSLRRFNRLLAAASTTVWASGPPSRPDDVDRDAPLLVRSWGANSADAAQLVGQLVAAGRGDVRPLRTAPSPPTTLLSALRSHLREEPFEPVAPDRTVSFHACVGELRQVETARNAVLHALAEDPTLDVGDVGILCGDLPRFAPYVDAVLGERGGAPPLPYVLRDRSLSKAVPEIAAVDDALRLLNGRFPRSAVVDLLRLPLVQRRFGIDVEQLDWITEWADATGLRWGLDADHRATDGLPVSFDAGTWRRSLDRLLAGVALPDGVASPLLGLRPVDVGHDLDRAGALCDALATLEALSDETLAARSVARWCEFVRVVAERLLSLAPAGTGRPSALQAMLERLEVDAAGADLDVEFEEFQAAFTDRAERDQELLVSGAGGVTITSFAPLRNVPFRVLVLLGVDDASLVRAMPPDAVFGESRVGDRDRRNEARGALLAAVLAARDRLIVTYDGSDLVTNDRIADSTVVAELHDALAQVCSEDVSVLVHSHPRHAHGTDDLVDDGSPEAPFSFDRGALQRARELAAAPRGYVGARVRVEGAAFEPAERTHASELCTFLRAPQRAFLWHALGVRLPPRDEPASDDVPTSVNDLDKWLLVRELVERGLEVGADDCSSEEWGRLCAAWVDEPDGPLASLPGRLRELELYGDDGVSERARELCRVVGRQVGTEPPEVLPVEVTLDGGAVLWREVLVYRGSTVVAWTPSTDDHRVRIDATVDLLLLAAAYPDRPWRAVRVCRRSRLVVPSTSVPGDTRDERAARARRALELLWGLRTRGLREAVPLFFRTSMAILDRLEKVDGATRVDDLVDAGRKGWSPYEGMGGDEADPAVRYCFDGSFDDLLQLPMVEGDPVADPRSGGSRLLAFTFALIDGLLAGDDAEATVAAR